MKDVNDLMQAILEMDAAQRKASEKAKAERTARLAALDARKQAIAAECDAKAQTDAEAAAKAADDANAEGSRRLETKNVNRLPPAMTAAAKQHEAEWTAELVRRAPWPRRLHNEPRERQSQQCCAGKGPRPAIAPPARRGLPPLNGLPHNDRAGQRS
ncbi:MAG: hypothetical protein ACLTY5_06285 [Angelakisella sp.]